MGKVTLGLASPHNPNITSRPEKISVEVQSKLDSAFARLRRQLSEASPDCLLILTSDHVTNFFYNNAPMFCLGVSDTCSGPAPKEMAELRIPRVTLKVETTMAEGLLHYGIDSGIDFSYSREMILDHAFMVPLSLLTPHMDLPIVPLHINGMLPPRPTAARCYRLGQALRRAVESHAGDLKVAILGTGGMSHQLQGKRFGYMNEAFDQWFLDRLEQDPEALVEITHHRIMEQAGAEAVELIMWLTMRGALPLTAKRVHRHYYAPMTTGMGLITLEG